MLLRLGLAHSARRACLWQGKKAISTVGLIKGETAATIKGCSYYGPIETAVRWVDLENNITKAIEEDAYDTDSLNDVKIASSNWCGGAELWDRAELKANVISGFEDTGTMTCLLGGKNTGKSTFFKSISATSHNVLVLDMRLNADIKKAVLSALKTTRSNDKVLLRVIDLFHSKRAELIGITTSILAASTSIPLAAKTVSDLVEQVFIPNKDTIGLEELLINLLDGLGFLTLVFDEANLVFNGDVKNWDQAKSDLEILVAMSKQNHQVNVLLVSSEHSFPYVMQKEMKFNLQNLERIDYFGEVPPSDMFELLTVKWGIRSNLALAIVDAYGGHILSASVAVKNIALARRSNIGRRFHVRDPYGNAILNVQPCLDWALETNRLQEMHTALRALANIGYFEVISENDRIAETISRCNVGGLVKRDSYVVGFKADRWNEIKQDWICVPASHAMRLIIANKLE